MFAAQSSRWEDASPLSSADSMHKKAMDHVPEILKPALMPVIEQLEKLTKTIKEYDRQIKNLSEDKYTETQVLRQVTGVGPITALAFILTLEDPAQFRNSREVGPVRPGSCASKGSIRGNRQAASDHQVR